MRILTCLLALLLSPALVAQITIQVKPNRTEYIAYEPINLTVTIQNQTGRPLSLRNSPTGNWIEFVVRNQNGNIVNIVNQPSYAGTSIPTAESVKSSFTLNNSYDLGEPGNYSVYAVVRTPQQAAGKGSRSAASYFTVNRGSVKWRTRVGVPGSAGDQVEYRIITTNSSSGTPPQLYVQVEDIKSGRILSSYSMGRYIRFREPIKITDKHNNLHVLFLSSPELYCHTTVNPAGETTSRKYHKAQGSTRPSLVAQADGSALVTNSKLYDPQQEREENNKFHNLSEIPGNFEQ